MAMTSRRVAPAGRSPPPGIAPRAAGSGHGSDRPARPQQQVYSNPTFTDDRHVPRRPDPRATSASGQPGDRPIGAEADAREHRDLEAEAPEGQRPGRHSQTPRERAQDDRKYAVGYCQPGVSGGPGVPVEVTMEYPVTDTMPDDPARDEADERREGAAEHSPQHKAPSNKQDSQQQQQQPQPQQQQGPQRPGRQQRNGRISRTSDHLDWIGPPHDVEKGIANRLQDGAIPVASHPLKRRSVDTPADRPPEGATHAHVGGDSQSEAEEEDDDFRETNCTRCTDKTHGAITRCIARHKVKIKWAFVTLLILLYAAYFVYAIVHDVTTAVPLIVLTFIVLLIVLTVVIHRNFGQQIQVKCCVPCYIRFARTWMYARWFLYGSLILGIVVFVGVDVRNDPRRLTSLSGLLILIATGYIFSKHPSRIRWRPVIWGLVMQWVLGLLVLRWSVGLAAVKWFSDQVVHFLGYADAGSKFVFGEENYTMHPFAFQSLPVVIFFSAIISVLYYIGLMQVVIQGMAWLMQVTMGTTAIESLASASNIFVSYVEVAPILVPYVSKLTRSELHAILTSGFATVAGSILAIYISFGAPAEHLVSACILSAPAALAMAKLSFPETKKSKTKTQKDVHIPPPTESNVIEAAANGAMLAIKLVAGIAACLIAFLGVVAFINAILSWLGTMVGIKQLNFKLICEYLLWPLAVALGVDIKDAKQVAGMLGWKIFVDEVICYQELGDAVKAGDLSHRSAVIATYACCGFGSLGAMGVALGAMMAITPKNKRGVITQLVIRALINGNTAAFMTACIAGLLYTGDDVEFVLYNSTFPASSATLSTLDVIYN